MDNYEFKKDVEERLLQLKYSHRVSKNQIALRCMFCGDSKKDPRKTRFYVYINTNDESPILYNCFNCQASGILTPAVLRTFDVSDLTLNSNLIKFNKSVSHNIKGTLYSRTKKLNLSVPVPKNLKSNIDKKKYIENRLGIQLSIDDIKRFKIVFSLQQFLEYNRIDDVTCSPNRAVRLNEDYVGFLNSSNDQIIYRDITNKNKLRYDKYTIFSDIMDGNKFYTIPNVIDITDNKPVIINMAEGVFDILGVYYNIKNQNDNEIYVAVCDSSYAPVIKYFLGLGLMGTNITINIFSDSDHPPYFYKKIYDEFNLWVDKINLFYNSKSKDFGVPKSQIEIYSQK